MAAIALSIPLKQEQKVYLLYIKFVQFHVHSTLKIAFWPFLERCARFSSLDLKTLWQIDYFTLTGKDGQKSPLRALYHKVYFLLKKSPTILHDLTEIEGDLALSFLEGGLYK